MTEPGATRLAYEEVDDATLVPSTARLRDGILSVDGTVRAGWIARPLAPGVGRRDLVPIVLRIEPVSAWRFVGLEHGTGELLAGEFHAHDAGGRVAGVIPGDLVVDSESRPRAWFETGVVASTGRAAVTTPTPPAPLELTAGRRAGLTLSAVAAAGGLLAYVGYLGLLGGLGTWDWDWNSALTVYFGRDRSWMLHVEHAWHYLVPVIVVEVVGVVAFFGGLIGAINPKRW